MKKVFYVLVLIIIGFNVNIYSQTDFMKNRFSIGTYNFVMSPGYRTVAHLQNYNDLLFNAHLSFTYRGDGPSINDIIDGYIVNPLQYVSTYSESLINLYMSPSDYHKQKVYFERAKVIRGALGQRSTYEAENYGTYQNKKPGYGYQSSETGIDYTNDLSTNVNGRMCVVGTHTAGYIVKDLFENMEQINYVFNDNSGKTDMQYFWSDTKDPSYYWVVKPRMRIKVADFDDLAKREWPVIRIDVNGYYNNQLIASYDIKVKDFKTSTNYYDGRYVEVFYNDQGDLITKLDAVDLSASVPANRDLLKYSKVDYAIHWYGNVDMWLDYVRLDDEWAHYLFTDPLGTATGNNEFMRFHQRIAEEIAALNPVGNEGNGFGYFYLDEYPYNSYPCIAEVNNIIKHSCPNTNTGLVAMDAEFALVGPDALRNPPFDGSFYDTLLSSGTVTDVLINESYPFENHNVDNLSDRTHFISIPTTLPLPAGSGSYPQNGWANHVKNMYKQATSDENYNYEINKNMELEYDFYFLGIYRKGADLIKKAKTKGKDILFSISIQNHVFEQKLGDGWTDEYGLRDVTNEEVSLQSYLGLIYGAKQIMDYSYNSDAAKVKADGTYYDYGLVKDENGTRRLTNYYGQPKWQYLCNLNAKLRQIGDYMYPAGESTKHLILDDSRTINTIFETYHPEYDYGLPYKYISDIISNYYVNGVIHSDNTDTRYWEVGTFKQPDGNTADKYSKYFIMLNKRCTPPLANVTAGDVRTLKMKFKPDELSGFNNWVVIDPLTNITIATIDKNSGEYYSLGIFQPGEGRLFKLAPVMQEGGTFVCDENVLNTSFVCKAIVYSGGYKLSLISNNSSPMTVSFKTSGMIHGDNGSEVQIYGTQNNKINLQGFGNEKGSGIDCEEINYLNISNANITGISAGWAITAYDCDGVSIENCNINLTENGMRAININSTSNSNTYSNILNNIISVKNCSTPVYVISSANASDDLFFAGNVITSSEQSQIGAFLSNVTSIYIYNNSIGGFETGIKLLGCTLDLTNNAITGLGTDFTGIYCTAESTINMGLVGDYYRGGINSFINTLGNNCVNIKLDNSVFNMDYGNNDLQVGLNTGSYNMYGTGNFATEDGPVRYIEAKGNCFNGDGNNAIHYLTDPDNYVFSLHELPHNCNIQQDMIAEFTVPITENITDTIYKTTNPQYQNLSNSKLLYRNFYKNILLKNYDSALIIGTNLLSNFADSVNSTDVISKLYFAVSKLDTGGQRTAALKTFYEQLILNNSQNSLLVMSANYFSQKCKVRLHQYTSALDGFQDIMAQNPYSYEGVVASWDYAATLLLANSSGGFAGDEENMQEISNIESNSEFLVDSIRINRLLKMDNYDKKIFTQENRKQLHKSVGDILKEGRNKQVEKVKTLEEKHTKADDKEKVKIQKEIEGSKLINSVVKVKKPKDNAEYQAIINSDIEKLHPKKNSAVTGKENCIPKTFELYQNYPNPFNPTTKIAFDLPKDAKVKLIIYDILGREVKTLVNNEFRAAGKYISEFNGSQLASGVYFARILINDGKEFVSVKKMVLIK